MMTRTEKLLAAELLRMASEQFSNYGCNDFELSSRVPDKYERDSLVRAYHADNGDPEEYYEAEGPGDYRLPDFAAMSFLANRLEAEPEDSPITGEQVNAVARAFHESYERQAPEYGYKTREASSVPWSDVPADNKHLMQAVVLDLLRRGVIRA
jgi:hypothetical protein